MQPSAQEDAAAPSAPPLPVQTSATAWATAWLVVCAAWLKAWLLDWATLVAEPAHGIAASFPGGPSVLWQSQQG